MSLEINVSWVIELGLQRRIDDRDVPEDTRRMMVDTSWDNILEAEGWVGVECQKRLNNPSEFKFHGGGR
jgi:hypothetical protein